MSGAAYLCVEEDTPGGPRERLCEQTQPPCGPGSDDALVLARRGVAQRKGGVPYPSIRRLAAQELLMLTGGGTACQWMT